MNLSLQIGRGLAALALGAAASAFAATHPASLMTPAAAPGSHTGLARQVAQSHAAPGKKQRCELPVPSIEIGAPIAITMDGVPLNRSAR